MKHPMSLMIAIALALSSIVARADTFGLKRRYALVVGANDGGTTNTSHMRYPTRAHLLES